MQVRSPPPTKGTPVVFSTPQQPLRVLLVDDDPVFRELLAFVLHTDLGAEIVGQAGSYSPTWS